MLKLEAIAPASTVVMCRGKAGSNASQHASVVLTRIHIAHNALAERSILRLVTSLLSSRLHETEAWCSLQYVGAPLVSRRTTHHNLGISPSYLPTYVSYSMLELDIRASTGIMTTTCSAKPVRLSQIEWVQTQ